MPRLPRFWNDIAEHLRSEIIRIRQDAMMVVSDDADLCQQLSFAALQLERARAMILERMQ